MNSMLNTEGAYSPQGLDFYEESAVRKESKSADDDEGYSPTIVRGRE